MLTDQESAIWEGALNHYQGDAGMFAAIAQVSDLAKKEFADTMQEIRDKPAYADRIGIEGNIYARYLLTSYAAQWAKGKARATGISLNVFPEEHLNGSQPTTYTDTEIAIAQAALLAS